MTSLVKRCVAELAGTALLVYFGAGAAAITLMIAAGTQPATPFNVGIGQLGGLGDWFAIGMAFAIVIAAVIYSMGRISGAHINPAVTIALFATKRFPAGETGAYVIVQLIGAAIGSLLFAATAGMDAVTIGTVSRDRVRAGNPCRDHRYFRPDAGHHGHCCRQPGTAGICRACDRAYGGRNDNNTWQYLRGIAQHGTDVWSLPDRFGAGKTCTLAVLPDLYHRADYRGGGGGILLRLDRKGVIAFINFFVYTKVPDQDPSLPGSTTPSFPLHRSHRDQQ
jgi:hypothetical protein